MSPGRPDERPIPTGHDRSDGRFDDGFDDALLSAYLDGEADAAERTAVERRLEEHPPTRELLHELTIVRTMLRSAETVAAPGGVLDAIALRVGDDDRDRTPAGSPERGGTVLRPRNGWSRRHPAVAAASAALVLLGAGTALAPPAAAVVPPIDDYVARHEAMAAPSAAASGPMPLAMQDVPMADADAMGGLPAMPTLGGMARDHVFSGPDGTQVMFRSGSHEVSVYERGGAVAWHSMPAGGAMTQMGTTTAWMRHDGGSSVVVVERGPDVYTIVGDASPDDLAQAVSELPVAPMDMAGRVRSLLDVVTRPFTL